MTQEELIEKYVAAHAECRWMDADYLRDLLTAFSDELIPCSMCDDIDEVAEVLARDIPDYTMEAKIKCVKAGAEWMKAKMLDGAVHGRIINDGGSCHLICPALPMVTRTGDIVKILIVKEDDDRVL